MEGWRRVHLEEDGGERERVMVVSGERLSRATGIV